MDNEKKLYLEADIILEKETSALKEAASSVITLPKDGEKQPDLLYFSAIFVSSGENLNHAYFLPTELVQAEGTIINKALDVEHNESEIIGHIYDRAFMNKEGAKLELSELKDDASAQDVEMHIAIAGIVYKNRFPNLAEEVANKKWKVSMECYYQDYDVKIGDLVMDKKEAESLGLACKDNSVFGKIAKVIKNKTMVAQGAVTRVLKGVLFSGCGIVKNPANPPSIIMETANNKEQVVDSNGVIILDYDKLEQSDNNVTSLSVEDSVLREESDLTYSDSVGICVNFKKRVLDSATAGPDSKVIHEDWCSLYDSECTSFSREATDSECLRRQDLEWQAHEAVEHLYMNMAAYTKRTKLLKDLESALLKADEALNKK